ncbi:hypothetical protein FBZ87_101513 [Nitrospirillum amazonense]|uniref:Extracellular solute-binding protein (Family 3) n=1 Tax=Nitrospirillum amazonense TaxID=28077 RepID=A0A560KHY1_9PROT|nr:amino acid ABC transporter substrate-binding protein [Nitrospirillum amazonense]TWB82802.1 hypothetical protein FBZ87_101513 [Nitrospirillum amazonense]
MTPNRRTVLSFLMALSAGGAGVARAQTSLEPVRMLVPELPVLGERGADGQARGLVVEQAQAILDRAGIRATVELLPVVRVYAELARERPPGGPKVYGMVAVPIRDPYRAIVPLALTMGTQLVAVARQGVTLAKPDDLRTVGPVAVTATGTQALVPVIQQYGITVQTVPSTLNGLRMMAHGRVNAVMGIASVIDVVARENNLTDQLGDRVQVSAMEAWLSCDPATRDAPETAILRDAAEALYREGRLDAIARQHFQKAATGS